MAKVDGTKELASRLKKIESSATSRIEDAILTGGLMVERDAKIKAPVDTGRLRQSITHRKDGFGTDNPAVEVFTSVNFLPMQNRVKSVKPKLYCNICIG